MENIKFIVFFLIGMAIVAKILIWHEEVRKEELAETARKLETARIREEVLAKRAERRQEKAEREKRKEALWAKNSAPLSEQGGENHA